MDQECNFHQEAIVAYCRTCQKNLCVICLNKEQTLHLEHKWVPIKEEIESRKKAWESSIKEIIEKSDNISKIYNNSKNVFNNEVQQVENAIASSQSKIQKASFKLNEKIENEGRTLISNVIKIADEWKNLNSELADCQKSIFISEKFPMESPDILEKIKKILIIDQKSKIYLERDSETINECSEWINKINNINEESLSFDFDKTFQLSNLSEVSINHIKDKLSLLLKEIIYGVNHHPHCLHRITDAMMNTFVFLNKNSKLFFKYYTNISTTVYLITKLNYVSIIHSSKKYIFIHKKLKETSPIIHYVETGNPMILHLFDLKSNLKNTIDLYNSENYIDSVIINKLVIICGGYEKDFLMTSMGIEFNNDLKCTKSNLGNMLIAKCGHTLVGKKANYCYCIGGENGNDLVECEKYVIDSKIWMKIPSLNYPDHWINAGIFDDRFIYTFGGYLNDKIEQMDSGYEDKWNLIYIDIKLETRGCGCGIQVDNEVMIIFGDYWRAKKNVLIFKPKKRTIEMIKSNFLNQLLFNQSKPVIFKNRIYCIGFIDFKRRFLSMNKNCSQIEEFQVNF